MAEIGGKEGSTGDLFFIFAPRGQIPVKSLPAGHIGIYSNFVNFVVSAYSDSAASIDFEKYQNWKHLYGFTHTLLIMDKDKTPTSAMRRVVATGDPTDPMVQFMAGVLKRYDSMESRSESSAEDASRSSGCSFSNARSSRSASDISDSGVSSSDRSTIASS